MNAMKPTVKIELFGKTYPLKNSIRAWQTVGVLIEIKDDAPVAEIYVRNVKILHGLMVSGAEYEKVFFGKSVEEVPSLDMLLNGLSNDDVPYIVEKVQEAINHEGKREIVVAPSKSKKGKNA